MRGVSMEPEKTGQASCFELGNEQAVGTVWQSLMNWLRI
jgi:hypothetical protein